MNELSEAAAICGPCGVEMLSVPDRESGAPVRDGGRALVRCPRCGDVRIASDLVKRRRYNRLVRWVTTILAGTGLLVEVGVEVLRHVDKVPADGPDSRAYLPVALAVGVIGVFHATVWTLGEALDRTKKDHVVERWVSFLLMGALFGVVVYGLVASWPRA